MITLIFSDKDKKQEFSVKFDYIDVTVDDIYSALEGILIAYGFEQDSIKNYYLWKAEEIKQVADED